MLSFLCNLRIHPKTKNKNKTKKQQYKHGRTNQNKKHSQNTHKKTTNPTQQHTTKTQHTQTKKQHFSHLLMQGCVPVIDQHALFFVNAIYTHKELNTESPQIIH